MVPLAVASLWLSVGKALQNSASDPTSAKSLLIAIDKRGLLSCNVQRPKSPKRLDQ